MSGQQAAAEQKGSTAAVASAASASTKRRSRGQIHASDIFSPRHMLILATAVLVAYGLVMTYSVSSVTSIPSSAVDKSLLGQFLSVISGLIPQLAITAAGIIVAMLIGHINVESLLKPGFIAVLYFATVALMLYTALAGGQAYGASRWLYLGSVSVQPSEFAKITMVLLCSRLMYNYFELEQRNPGSVILYIVSVVILMASIGLQQDMGTLVILAVGIFCMLIIAGCRLRYLLILAGCAAVAAIVLVANEGYRMGRIASWLGNVFDDESLSSGEGYQLRQGLYALGTGGFFGTGLGTSRLKYGYLTQADNDFIFAVIGEELGFLFGTLPVIVMFVLFGWAGFSIAEKATDMRGKLLAGGMTSLILIQAFINIGGVIKLIPETGRTLPFVSSGNSSLLASLLMVGFILAVDKRDTWSQNEKRARKARGGFGVIQGGRAAETSRSGRGNRAAIAGLPVRVRRPERASRPQRSEGTDGAGGLARSRRDERIQREERDERIERIERAESSGGRTSRSERTELRASSGRAPVARRTGSGTTAERRQAPNRPSVDSRQSAGRSREERFSSERTSTARQSAVLSGRSQSANQRESQRSSGRVSGSRQASDTQGGSGVRLTTSIRDASDARRQQDRGSRQTRPVRVDTAHDRTAALRASRDTRETRGSQSARSGTPRTQTQDRRESDARRSVRDTQRDAGREAGRDAGRDMRRDAGTRGIGRDARGGASRDARDERRSR
jgi:cell division protein FtsW